MCYNKGVGMGRFTDLAKAYYNYFKGVGECYLENTVPETATFPYITYTLEDGEYTDNLLQTIRVYDNQGSVGRLAGMVDKIDQHISNNNVMDVNNNVYFTVYKGTPFAQYVNEVDGNIKSMYINLQINVY
jgi:hypothetical protein